MTAPGDDAAREQRDADEAIERTSEHQQAEKIECRK